MEKVKKGDLTMRKIRMIVLSMLLVTLALAMSACGSKTETGEMSGKLTEAMENSIVVDAGGQSTEFITEDSTVYYLGNTDHLTLNDEIRVEYHTKGSKSYADVITLEKHVEEELTFTGVISDVNDERVTVTGNSLTVEFIKNGDTSIGGDMSKGDEVEVVYTDNSKINAGTYTARARLMYDTHNCEADEIPDLRWKIAKASYDTSDVHWNYEEPFSYDGTEKSIALEGVPTSINVRYRDNRALAAGTYTAKAYLTYDNDNYEEPDIDTTIEWEIK